MSRDPAAWAGIVAAFGLHIAHAVLLGWLVASLIVAAGSYTAAVVVYRKGKKE